MNPGPMKKPTNSAALAAAFGRSENAVVTRLVRLRAGLHPLELGIPMLTAAHPLHRQSVPVLLIDGERHISRIRLVELAVVITGERLQRIHSGPQLIHAHIIL